MSFLGWLRRFPDVFPEAQRFSPDNSSFRTSTSGNRTFPPENFRSYRFSPVQNSSGPFSSNPFPSLRPVKLQSPFLRVSFGNLWFLYRNITNCRSRTSLPTPFRMTLDFFAGYFLAGRDSAVPPVILAFPDHDFLLGNAACQWS